MIATKQLAAEHETIKVALRILDAICWGHDAGRLCDLGHLEALLDFFTVYVKNCHHCKEEKALFAAMLAPEQIAAQGSVDMLRREHQLIHTLIGDMAELLRTLKAGKGLAMKDFTEKARNYIGLESMHIEKENSMFFPMADLIIGEAKQPELAARFAEIEGACLAPGRSEGFERLLQTLRAAYLP